jgi:nitrite reductase/ring-hydroxylating ferredoxin subunit
MTESTALEMKREKMSRTTWMKVGTAESILDDEMVLLRAGDRHIVVYAVDGKFFATDGLCTHEQAPLIDGYLDGDVIECPKHNARFHVCSGKVLRRPAQTDLKVYPVAVEDGIVSVEVPTSSKSVTSE